jgi:hypothetical protein
VDDAEEANPVLTRTDAGNGGHKMNAVANPVPTRMGAGHGGHKMNAVSTRTNEDGYEAAYEDGYEATDEDVF